MADDPAIAALEVRMTSLEQRFDELDLPKLHERLGQLFGGNGHGEHGLLMVEIQSLRNSINTITSALPRPWTDMQKAIWALTLMVVMGVAGWWLRNNYEEQRRQDEAIQQIMSQHDAMLEQLKQLEAKHKAP